MLLDRIIYRTDFMFEICFKNTYYGLVSYPSVFNAFLLKEPSVLFRRVFLCEKDSFHYPTFFEDLDGLTVSTRWEGWTIPTDCRRYY